MFSPKARNIIYMREHQIPVPNYHMEICRNYKELKESSEEVSHQKFARLKSILEKWDCPYFIVRPSLALEDTQKHSFAGVMDSTVFSCAAYTYEADRQIRADVYDKIQHDVMFGNYMKKIGLSPEQVRSSEITLIYQEFIEGTVSGVMFTRNPGNQKNEMVVESVEGLNFDVTSGQTSPDCYLINREDGSITSFLGNKKYLLTLQSDGTTEKTLNPNPDRGSLSQEKLKKLFEIGNELEALFEAPQDIEWSFRGEELYILQSRPIVF